MQPLTRYSSFNNLPCSSANLLMVEAGRISVGLNTSGVNHTITLDILKSFDIKEHTTGLLHKINFYCVYSKIFFLIESFRSSRRL